MDKQVDMVVGAVDGSSLSENKGEILRTFYYDIVCTANVTIKLHVAEKSNIKTLCSH